MMDTALARRQHQPVVGVVMLVFGGLLLIGARRTKGIASAHPAAETVEGRAPTGLYAAGSRPFNCSARNGPGSAIRARAASTWPQVFHRSTPRTRPASR